MSGDGRGLAPARAQWTAEVEVSPALAAELIAGQFPELGSGPVTPLATGWDNTVVLVDGEWLFRFPRREVALPGVRREIALLPRLAPVLPLPVPDPRFIGRPSERYPWPFFGARLLPGTELAASGLADARRGPVAAGTGRFLRALGEPQVRALARDAALPVDPMRRGSPAVRAGRAREVLDRLADAGVWAADPAVYALLDEAARVPERDQPGELVVAHGDLHVRHVLTGADGAASGIIDWGDVCLADPAVDLSLAYFGFAGAARAEFLAAYGRPVGPERELAARICALSVGASLTEYAADQGQATLLRECRAGLARVMAD